MLVRALTSGGGGGFTFSTSETLTGLKWTDGKDIYAKTYSDTNVTTLNYSISLPSGYDKVIDWTVVADVQGSGNYVNGGYWSPSSGDLFAVYTLNGNLYIASSWATLNKLDITVFYTKS